MWSTRDDRYHHPACCICLYGSCIDKLDLWLCRRALPPGDAEHTSWLSFQIYRLQVKDLTGCVGEDGNDWDSQLLCNFGGEMHIVLLWVSCAFAFGISSGRKKHATSQTPAISLSVSVDKLGWGFYDTLWPSLASKILPCHWWLFINTKGLCTGKERSTTILGSKCNTFVHLLPNSPSNVPSCTVKSFSSIFLLQCFNLFALT